MLSREMEKRLFERYGVKNDLMKKAFDATLVEGFAERFKAESEKHACVFFLDIAEFSTKIAGWTPRRVAKYLDEYYAVAFPCIAENFGKIDRVVGDGIVAVFSPFFHADLSNDEADDYGLKAAERAIARLHATNAAAKAALGLGKLFFCRTGVTEIYEDYTVVGHPLTMVYRLEAIAEKNTIFLPDESGLARREREKAARGDRARLQMAEPVAPKWIVDAPFSRELPGIDGQTRIFKETYCG